MASATNHTPGPWTVSEENCGGGCNIRAESGQVVAHTAEFYDLKRDPIRTEEAKANAVLVALAPQLARALVIAEEAASCGHYASAADRDLVESTLNALLK